MLSGVFRYLRCLLLLGACLGFSAALAWTAPFSLTGSLDYAETGGDVEETWQFNQTYSLLANKELTASSNLSANFRYTKNRRSEGSDIVLMSPSATLTLRNDLFSMSLSGTQTERETSDRSDLTSRSWEITGFSLSERFPQLRLSYGQTTNGDDQNPHQVDSETDYFNSSVNYSWRMFELFYDFRVDTDEDHVDSSKSESVKHFAKVEYSDSFFNGKIGVNLAQQYSNTDSEIASQVGSGGTLFIPVGLSQTLVAQDDTPLTGGLATNGALSDGDTSTATTVEIAQALVDQNLGMQTDFQPVNQLRVYLDREIALGIQSQLSWSIYVSTDNIDWTLVSNTPVVSYDLEDSLTVVAVDVPGSDILERYVKLVVSSTGLSAEPVYVAELEAGSIFSTAGDNVSTSTNFVSYQTRANVTYTPNSSWAFAYNMTRVKNEPDPGLESTQLNQVVSASYTPTGDFSAAASISENRDETETREENLSRTYSLSLQKHLIETMRLSIGYTHTDGYMDSTRKSGTDAVNGFITAQLFPDLSANLNINWSKSENLQNDTDSENYGFRLNGTARLTPRVDMSAYYDYRANSIDGVTEDTEEDDTQYGTSVNFRTSDILRFYASLTRNEDTKRTFASGAASWRLTPKIQVNFSHSRDLEEGESEKYATNLSWQLSSHFSLRGTANYMVLDDGDTWSWRVNMNAIF